MKHVKKVVLTVVLAGSQLLAQGDPEEQFHEACVFEKRGQFDKAIDLAKELTDSGQSSGGELGRAWILLGVVYTEQGRFAEAQSAFERSLRILDGTRDALQGRAARPSYPERLLAKNGNKDLVVPVSDIEWIEAADYYVCLHAGGKTHLLRESIKGLDAKLDPGKFVRLHRSAIVNINHVREIHRDGRADGWVLLSTGARVRMNRTGWQKLIALNSL
jgi:DNA-binding LytR/AlgR family response regulator